MTEECFPLIISGAPRSGTSLLYNLFDGHPEVAWLVDEGFLFEHLHALSSGPVEIFLDAVPSDLDRLITGLRDRQIMPPNHVRYVQSKERGSVSKFDVEADWDETACRAALAEPSGPGIAGLWQRLARAWLAGMGKSPRRYACMKAPDYGRSAVAVIENIPDARAIVIVRDPLHAIDSLKRSREMRGEKLLTWPMLAECIRWFQELDEHLEGTDADRLNTVRYETLLTDPETTMRGLSDWLGIAFDPTLLTPTMHGRHWPGISSFQATDGIDSDPAERPIIALSEDEVNLVRRHLGPFRTAHGYA